MARKKEIAWEWQCKKCEAGMMGNKRDSMLGVENMLACRISLDCAITTRGKIEVYDTGKPTGLIVMTRQTLIDL